ncbi:hypothetical protein [Endozoicomonas euniceicola]|uniref:Uncharacterized protein n=1 Tax=Endozoicomonas euniceicola TaxID=1234143 RepID=A0ABY6GZH8_9GAMM|nr:hypothetical protein [Endozoicomonas euniceicola]UYM18215.1 hypothetical protein NX720_10010 [Endozoicomonas euniceicola]
MINRNDFTELSAIFERRLQVKELPNHYPHAFLCAKPAESCYIFELLKTENFYFLQRQSPDPKTGNIIINSPTANFDFVILIERPLQVFCVPLPIHDDRDDPRRPKPSPEILEVPRTGGHTSISGLSSVLYAGGLRLENGRLIYWTNHSGHYRPSYQIHKTNISPVVNLLLPKKKFFPITRG